MYAKYGPTIYARCRRLLKHHVVAEDATQDVFVKVMRHIESAPAESAVLAWISRITTNHCLNVLRDARHDAEPVERLPELVDHDFEASVVARDFATHVLEQSPELLRTPAMLYHARGMDQSRVAQTLGVSRRTVLYRLAAFSRGAMKLHQAAES